MKILNNFTNAQSKVSQNLLHHFKTILIILLICGFNFKFYTCNYVNKVLIVLYCVFLTVAVTYSTVTCCSAQGVPRIWSLLQYVSSVLASLILKSNMKSYFKKISELDRQLRINVRYYCQLKKKTYFYLISLCAIRFTYTWIYCYAYNCYCNLSLFLVNQFSLFALDMFRGWRFFLFNIIRYRLRVLRLRLEEHASCNFYLYAIDKKIMKERKIKFCLFLYKSLADVAECIMPELSASMFISILCNLPKVILNTYYALLIIENEYQDQDYVSGLFFAALHISQISLFLFSSCILVELYSMEVEKIRRILGDRLVSETNEATKKELEMFLQYTEIRSFQYKIWRIIPLNMQLPLEIINICTTYVIVIANFTHLY